MTREEFKQGLSDLVDQIVDTNRDLAQEDVDALTDQLNGDVVEEIIGTEAEDEDEAKEEPAKEEEK